MPPTITLLSSPVSRQNKVYGNFPQDVVPPTNLPFLGTGFVGNGNNILNSGVKMPPTITVNWTPASRLNKQYGIFPNDNLALVASLTNHSVQEKVLGYTTTFIQANLNGSNQIFIQDNLETSAVTVTIYNANNQVVIPNNITAYASGVLIDMSSFVPLSGTFRAVIQG